MFMQQPSRRSSHLQRHGGWSSDRRERGFGLILRVVEDLLQNGFAFLKQAQIDGNFWRQFVGQYVQETFHLLQFFLLLLILLPAHHLALVVRSREHIFPHLNPSLQRLHVRRCQLVQFLLALIVEFLTWLRGRGGGNHLLARRAHRIAGGWSRVGSVHGRGTNRSRANRRWTFSGNMILE